VGNTYYGLTFTGEKVLKLSATDLHVRDNSMENNYDEGFRMCFKDNAWKMCNDLEDEEGYWDESWFQTRYGKFRRSIVVKGLFLKDNNP
jgi:hypothetical protein